MAFQDPNYQSKSTAEEKLQNLEKKIECYTQGVLQVYSGL